MKKIIVWIIVIMALTLGVSYFVGLADQSGQQQNLSGFTVEGDKYYLTAGAGNGQAAGQIGATTTPVYMQTTQTASSTVIGWTGRATSLDLNIGMIASTSATSRLIYTVAFSPNYDSSTGNGDWYFEDGSSVDSVTSVTHGASPLIHQFTPLGTAWVGRNMSVSAVQSRWFKVTASVTGANAAVTIQAIPKEDNNN